MTGRTARRRVLRVQAGDDASCLNLYQARQPRVLGVSNRFIRRGGFAWSSTAAHSAEEHANPWLLLDKKLPAADGREVVLFAVYRWINV